MEGAAALYTSPVPAKPERKTVEAAAQEVGVSAATVWRYLERGWLRRYYTRVGRRKTVVDMAELRRVLANPPSEPA